MPVLLTPFADHEVEIPEWVTTNASFLRWAQSDDAPEKGKFGFLRNQLWVDYSMETLFHNFIKQAIYSSLGTWVIEKDLGDLLPDGMLLSVPSLDFTTQPDGMFVSHASWETKRVKVKKSERSVVVYGSPDMILEVVSLTTKRKDTQVLRDLYWQAKVKEYWLVDSQQAEPELLILKRTAKGYQHVKADEASWVYSKVFDASFRLVSVNASSKRRVRLERR
jgi:Uma2 family endonuclease